MDSLITPGTAMLLRISILFFLLSGGVIGHAVVHPRESGVHTWERYVLRVPNERNLPTTRVSLTFPKHLRVVSFSEVHGWQLSVVRDSLSNPVSATWEGLLDVERFVEFPFVAQNPSDAVTLTWPAEQTYSDGEVVAWTGEPDSPTPASVTMITTTAMESDDESQQVSREGFAVQWIALGLSVCAVIIALLKRR